MRRAPSPRSRARLARFARFRGGAVWLLALLGAASCTPGPGARPPSIVLAVLDTTRRDAVSAYGAVRGTTPTIDALAAQGLLYTEARASAPWTVPSHATLFTGLLPSQHGVDWRNPHLAAGQITLADRLRDAGYETAGFSENPWLGPISRMDQGFATHSLARSHGDEIVPRVEAWLRGRRPDLPFFLFLNLNDPHTPWEIRTANPFLPPGVTADEAGAISQAVEDHLCSAGEETRDDAILRGLYLGEVASADRKLGSILALLDRAAPGPRIVIVTSDHGECLGEALGGTRLFSHQFSVAEPVLRVPLVVHGVPGAGPAAIDTPVALADVLPSILEWARLPVPDGLAGRPLPLRPDAAAPERALVAEFVEPEGGGVGRRARARALATRRNCRPEHLVFGGMRSVVRPPFKLIAFDRYPPLLFDLASDPGERHDLASARPELVAALRAELDARTAGAPPPPGAPPAASEADLEELEALGYLEK